MIRIITVAIMSLFLCSCIDCTSYDNNIDNEVHFANPTVIDDNVIIFRTDFNNEHYIWESFYFPTNRTSGVQ